MKIEYPSFNYHNENDKLAKYRKMIEKERLEAKKLKTPAGRWLGLAAARLSEAVIKE